MIACYDADGRLFNVYQDPIPPGLTKALDQAGHSFLEMGSVEDATEFMMTNMVVCGQVTARPTCPVAVNVDGSRVFISGAPDTTAVSVKFEGLAERHPVPLVDGRAEFEIDEPGLIKVSIVPPWPFLEAEHDLEIVEG